MIKKIRKSLRFLKEILNQLPGCKESIFLKHKAEILDSNQYSKDFKEKTSDLLELLFLKERNDKNIEFIIRGMFFSFNRTHVWNLIKLIQNVVVDIIVLRVDEKLKFNTLNNFIKIFTEFETEIHKKFTCSSSEFVKNISEYSSIIFLIKEDKENWPVKYISSNIENLGYQPDEFIYNKKNYNDIIHPEDIDRTLYMTSYCKLQKVNYFTQNYRLLTSSKEIRWIEDRSIIYRNENNEVEYFQSLLIDVTDKTLAQSELALKNRALEVAANGIMICDVDKKIVWVNSSFSNLTGYSASDAKNISPSILIKDFETADSIKNMWEKLFGNEVWKGKYSSLHKFGAIRFHETVITPVNDQNGNLSHFIWIISDISEKKKYEDERILMETKLRHSQKMESIGLLAAGIAHEINTPIQYVSDNLSFLNSAMNEYNNLIENLKSMIKIETVPESFKIEFKKKLEDIDLEFIQEEIPNAFEQTDEGLTKVSNIVNAMKKFAHPSSENKELNNVYQLLENISIVAKYEWKYVTELKIIVESDIPLIPCYADQLNQVFLNMIINSAHSIKEKFKDSSEKGIIKIEIKKDDEYLIISISDNGNGIPDEIVDKIYDPFFSTKEVGKGMGQGLAIAHDIIFDKHNGKIEMITTINEGTKFFIYLPLIDKE